MIIIAARRILGFRQGLRCSTIRANYLSSSKLNDCREGSILSSSSADNGLWRKHNKVRKLLSVESTRELELFNLSDPISGLPQIAVLGRSNVGKSSLLNHIFGKGNRAKASSRAGKTQTIDVFGVNDSFAIADLPGYSTKDGQVSEQWGKYWGPLVKSYLSTFNDTTNDDPNNKIEEKNTHGSHIHALLFLCDIRWRATKDDRDMLEFVRDKLGLPILVVFTKDDRITVRGLKKPHPYMSRHKYNIFLGSNKETHIERTRLAKLRREELNWRGPHIHFSSAGGTNHRRCRSHLRRYIKTLVEAKSSDERHDILDAAWTRGAGKEFIVETRRDKKSKLTNEREMILLHQQEKTIEEDYKKSKFTFESFKAS